MAEALPAVGGPIDELVMRGHSLPSQRVVTASYPTLPRRRNACNRSLTVMSALSLGDAPALRRAMRNALSLTATTVNISLSLNGRSASNSRMDESRAEKSVFIVRRSLQRTVGRITLKLTGVQWHCAEKRKLTCKHRSAMRLRVRVERPVMQHGYFSSAFFARPVLRLLRQSLGCAWKVGANQA